MPNRILFGLAAAALLFMVPGTADPYQTPRLLALAGAAWVVLSTPAAGWSRLTPFLLAGLGAWLTAALFSLDATYTVLGSRLAPFDSLTAVLLYAALVVAAARTGGTVREAAEAVCWAALPVAAYAITQKLVADPLLPATLPNMRSVATQGSPVYLGVVLAVVVACAAGVRGRLGYATLALVLPALWATGTRGAWLGAAAAGWVLLPGRLRWAALLAIPAVLWSGRAGAMVADLGRIEVWRGAWELFLAHPWTGTGPGTFLMAFRSVITPGFVMTHGSVGAIQAHAHNQLLHVLATTGLVGLAGYLSVLVGLALTLRRAPEEDRPLLAAAAAAYAVPAMLNPAPHAATALLAVLFGCASAVRTGGGLAYAVRPWQAACALAGGLAAVVAVSDASHASAIYAARAGDPMGYLRGMRQAAGAGVNDPQLTARYLDALLKVMPYASPAGREELVDESLRAAQALLYRHPADPWAWEIAGRSVQLGHATGLGYELERAADMYAVAQDLAPTFIPIMERRLQVARLMGDKKTEQAALADIARVTAWTKGG